MGWILFRCGSMSSRGINILISLSLFACGGGHEEGPTDAAPDALTLPLWDPGLADSSVLGTFRGLERARGIVHVHSPYSWDACDGEPRAADGTLDEACVADLRQALCVTRMDYAALTDHDESMADEPWGPELFLARGDDQPLLDLGGNLVASRLACEDGHHVLLTVGGENELMPIMLDRHPEGDVVMVHEVYNANDADTVATFRSLGGLAWVAHSESKDLALLRDLGLDGMEVYNFHAAIDPDIRPDWLGLDAGGGITAALEFGGTDPDGPEPDLAVLPLLFENLPSLEKWHTLLGEGARMAVTAGTDAHQNALNVAFKDGERGDSYRRMIRWFSNVALVEDRTDPAGIEAAFAAGRLFVAFEILGTPEGFDARLLTTEGDRELGAEVPAAQALSIEAATPHVAGLDPGLPAPTARTRILRVDALGVEEIAAGEGVVTAPAITPGAYLVEVRITPRHLGPYLREIRTDYAEREYVWIYASPLYVR